ncbi:hypothetical protein [Methylocystis suflitae]|uniref:hypothetical protein n=1 Tax=Methylocystis suflitae TaxID=2951405 RepID=UPI00210C0C19|nr:hypothetical protein [Methylocystis suflitae]MCQ4190944.1 hypothetical protein [Methylocystis suflitae]
MSPANDNRDPFVQLKKDLRFVLDHEGKRLRKFVRVTGVDAPWRPNPLVTRLEAAAARLKAAGWIGNAHWRDSMK